MEFGQLVSNENQTSKIQDIENDIYRVLHEKSNIAAFSVEHQTFLERNFSFIQNVSSHWTKISN